MPQFETKGKDAFQIRDYIYDYAKGWLLYAGVERSFLEQKLMTIMNHVDMILISPNEDQRETSKENASDIFGYLVKLLSGKDPETGETRKLSDRGTWIMNGFDSLLDLLFQVSSSTLPHLQDDNEHAYRLLSAMKYLNHYAVNFEKSEPRFFEDAQQGKYVFYVDTEEGLQHFGPDEEHDLIFEGLNPKEAEQILTKLVNAEKEFRRLGKDDSVEAKGQRIRTMTQDISPSEPAQEVGEHRVAFYRHMFLNAYQESQKVVDRLQQIKGQIGQAVSSMQYTAPNLNVGSLYSILDSVINDLNNSVASMREAASGRLMLDLSQFDKQSSWAGTKKIAQLKLPREAYVIRDLLKEVQKVLLDFKNRLQASLGIKVESSSWKVLTAADATQFVPTEGVVTSPVPRSIPGTPMVPVQSREPEKSETQVPAKPGPFQIAYPTKPNTEDKKQQEYRDEVKRVLQWEIALVVGASNRGIKEISDILQDQNFWRQFVRSFGGWKIDEVSPPVLPGGQTVPETEVLR